MSFDFTLFADVLFTRENSHEGIGIWIKYLKPLLLYADTVNVYLNFELSTGSKVEWKDGFLGLFDLDERDLISFQCFRLCVHGSKHAHSWRNDERVNSIGNSFPVFSGNVYNEENSTLTTQNLKIGHLFNDLSIKLPNIETLPIDEILDIKKELEKPLVNFRKKVLRYSESIQSMPYEQGFLEECHRLYYTEISPSILEIEELSNENSFIKNLGSRLISNEGFLKSTGGLMLGLFAAGALSTVAQAPLIASEVITGGAWMATKIIEAYKDYSETKKSISKHDLCFYHEVNNYLRDRE